jgi:hypothetical protein
MRRADIALLPRIPAGVDYIFTLLNLEKRARGQRLIAAKVLPIYQTIGKTRYLTVLFGEEPISRYGVKLAFCETSRLPTVLSGLESTVISWHYCLMLSTRHTPNVEVPNLPVAVDARGRSACYPRGSFYPLSPDPSTRGPRIT